MLVVIPGRDSVIVVPRLERGAAEAGLRTDVRIMAWAEGTDAYAAVVDLVRAATDREAPRIAVSDTLIALHLLRLQAALPTATFELASLVLRELRMRKDADEIALLTLAAHAADRVVAAIAAGRLVGRTEADVAREVRERLIDEGHDVGLLRDRRLRSELRLAAPRGVGPGDRRRRADRPRHRRRARRLLLRHHADALGHRRRRGASGRALPAPVRGPPAGPGGRDRRRAARRVACETVDATARRIIEAEGYGEAVLPPDRPRHRPRRPRGPVHRRGEPAAARRGMAFRSSPASISTARTARASRTSSSADRMARSCSTRRPASCTSSTARLRRAWPSHGRRPARPRSTPKRAVSSGDGPPRMDRHRPRPDDHQPPAPPHRRRSPPGRRVRVRRPVSRRRGRPHHHDRARPPGPRPATPNEPRPVQAAEAPAPRGQEPPAPRGPSRALPRRQRTRCRPLSRRPSSHERSRDHLPRRDHDLPPSRPRTR